MNKYAEEINIHFISYAGISFKAETDAEEMNIDWGDGNTFTFSGNSYFNFSHIYSREGLYIIRIYGHKIRSLDISALSLIELQLKNCSYLEYLNCSVNELNELDLSQCPSLEELYCNSNNLRQLDLHANRLLTQIHVSYNLLHELDISVCEKLHTLYCSNNHLISLHINGCKQLIHLDFSYNLLNKEQVDEIFRQLSADRIRPDIYYLKSPDSEL